MCGSRRGGAGTPCLEKPDLFFTLRQANQAELLSSATAGVVSRQGGEGQKRIAADRLADVFGIEIEDERAVPGAAAKRRRRPAPPRGKRARPVTAAAPRRGRAAGRNARRPRA